MTHDAYTSLLFVPGHRPDWLRKSPGYGSDALIFDLEDLVPAQEKEAARRHIAAALQDAARSDGTDAAPDLIVRVNARSPDIELDLSAIVRPGLNAVMLPKADDPLRMREIDGFIAALEHERGLERGSIALIPAVEEAAGIMRTYDVLRASPRISAVATSVIEGGDVSRSVGYHDTPDGLGGLHLMAHIQLQARAAGVQRTYVLASADPRDLNAAERSMRRARTIGFTGATMVNPRHVPVARSVFGPSSAEIEEARLVLAALDGSTDGGPAFHAGKVVDGLDGEAASDVLQRAAAVVRRASTVPARGGDA